MTYTVNTNSAVYEFTTVTNAKVVHVTKWILKGSGSRDAHVSTSTDIDSARKWFKQLRDDTN